jgi:hypothetical protein
MSLLSVRELMLQAEVVFACRRLGLEFGYHLFATAVKALAVHSITHQREVNHQQTSNKIIHGTKTE